MVALYPIRYAHPRGFKFYDEACFLQYTPYPQTPRRSIVAADDDTQHRGPFRKRGRKLCGPSAVGDRLGRRPTEAEVETRCRYNNMTIHRYFGTGQCLGRSEYSTGCGVRRRTPGTVEAGRRVRLSQTD